MNSNEESGRYRETLTVTVNKRDHEIPADFGSTPQEFAEACGYGEHREWRVYRQDNPKMQTGPEDRCEEPMVVSDGDRFVIIPRYINGA